MRRPGVLEPSMNVVSCRMLRPPDSTGAHTTIAVRAAFVISLQADPPCTCMGRRRVLGLPLALARDCMVWERCLTWAHPATTEGTCERARRGYRQRPKA